LTTGSARDCWAEWIADRRFGGDPELAREFLDKLGRVRERVLEHGRVGPGDTVLDECRKRTGGRARFVQAAADDLRPIDDESIDVVTTRSVLIYVKHKARAFREFHRVLRSGGRMSLYEPINVFASDWTYDFGPHEELKAKINSVYDAIQPPREDPMLDFDERDLIRLAEESGFHPVELDYRAEIRPIEPRPWETFLRMAGNPRIPTLEEAMAQVLTPEETERLAAHLRPLVEKGRGTWRMAHAYLWATKP
jgi:arsenite methyltransferase